MSPPLRPTVVMPDAVLWATEYLRAQLDVRPEAFTADVLVSDEVPNPREPRMVIVRRDGGRSETLFDNPRLSFRVWSPRKEDANALAAMVEALVLAAPGHGPVIRATSESGPSKVTDESAVPLRYLVISIRTRGKQL
ncbi:hypothetical protein [Nocardioides alkalitolerans]|uniref:hypothetical protein n=1 Tax=Nocardioides alkalitolerans TaxID=281714 RepID=UPI000404CDE6|nr:hypothetical protein [Nocardioides alkalitolerans]